MLLESLGELALAHVSRAHGLEHVACGLQLLAGVGQGPLGLVDQEPSTAVRPPGQVAVGTAEALDESAGGGQLGRMYSWRGSRMWRESSSGVSAEAGGTALKSAAGRQALGHASLQQFDTALLYQDPAGRGCQEAAENEHLREVRGRAGAAVHLPSCSRVVHQAPSPA